MKFQYYKINGQYADGEEDRPLFRYNIYLLPSDKTCEAPAMGFLHCGKQTVTDCVEFWVGGSYTNKQFLGSNEAYCIKNTDSNKVKLVKEFGDSTIYVKLFDN